MCMNRYRIRVLSLTAGILLFSACKDKTEPKPAATETPAVTVSDIIPDSSSVRLIGRTYRTADTTWLPQSGSAIEFQVTGRSITLELAGDNSVFNEPDLQPRFAVLLNGSVILDDTLGEPKRTIEVFREDTEQTAVIEVIHLSEANQGELGIKKITVESSAVNPLTPTENKAMCIEFIGDSITCGYGVEGKPGDTEFMTTTENFMRTFAYLTAQKLGADYSTIAFSGYGIVSGYTADGTKQEDMLIPPLYDYVSQSSRIPWNHKTHDYDVIVINLGTNDNFYTENDPKRIEEFAEGYESFLSYVHQTHPESRVICMLGAMGGEQLFPSVEQAVKHVKETDGSDITALFLPKIDPASAGTDGHPNPADQQEIAAVLVEAIQRKVE